MAADALIGSPELPLLIRQAQLLDGATVDLRIEGGRIVGIAPQLPAVPSDRLVDAGGNLLLPGLHDHHLHLFGTATARESVLCGPPAVHDEAALGEVLARRCRQGEGWIRGVGFHDSVCAHLDRHWLDRICPDRPVRIQHRSGMLWVLNSCALDLLQLTASEPLPAGVERDPDGGLSGRFFDLDDWLGARIGRRWPSLAALSSELARFGITAVTDTGVNNGVAVWRALGDACARGEITQRLLVMSSEALQREPLPSIERMALGPLKLYLREVELPDLDLLVQRMREAHESGRAVAVHCVTRVELHYALAALDEAGARAGDRIEHAAVADEAAIERLAQLGVTVVTQPHFIAERGDQYRRDVEAEDLPLLYRGAGFLRGGVALAAGSDAPYGGTNPWLAMQAAVMRRTTDGVVMSEEEQLTPRQALALFGGDAHHPGGGLRPLAVGQEADLCLLDRRWERLRDDFGAAQVRLTLCSGAIAYRAPA